MTSFTFRISCALCFIAILTRHLGSSSIQIQCPDLSYLDQASVLACFSSQPLSTIVYKAPTGNSPQCTPTDCTHVRGYQAVRVNSSYSELKILDVQQKHAGRWGCSEGDANFIYDQLVVAENTTSCRISWDAATVRLHQKVSVTVVIQDYYCSVTSNVTIRVGSVQDLLTTVEAKPTNTTVTREINVTAQHLGNIQLEFTCSSSRNISCSGLKNIDVPSPDNRVPPDNQKQVVSAVLITFFVTIIATIIVVIIIWVIVYKREIVMDCLNRIHRGKVGHSDLGHESTVNT